VKKSMELDQLKSPESSKTEAFPDKPVWYQNLETIVANCTVIRDSVASKGCN